MDAETRKRKVEEEEEVKRARQKTGKIDNHLGCCFPTNAHVLESSCLVGELPDVPVRYVWGSCSRNLLLKLISSF